MKHKKYKVVKLTQLAAMFGLDARIALAIFGSLSIIVGVSMYEIFERSKKVAFISTLDGISKGIEAYLIDTRKDIPLDPAGGGGQERKMFELISSTKKGWQGPYIKGRQHSTSTKIIKIQKGYYYLYSVTENNLGGNSTSSGWGGEGCSSGNNCYYWIRMHICNFGWDSTDALLLDKMIDGGDGIDKGRFRANWYLGDKANPIIFYKVQPTLN